MKKRSLAMLSFIACALAACGKTPSPTPTPGPDNPTPVDPEEPVVESRVLYDYQFNNPEDIDQNAFGSPGEGDGIVVKEGGYATTIMNGDLEEGPAKNWTYCYEGYDRGITAFELESTVKVLTYDGCGKQVGVSFRFGYDWCFDIQFQFPTKKGGESGVYLYNANGNELDRANYAGNVPNEWTKLTMRFIRNADNASTHLVLFCNDVCCYEDMAAPWIINENCNQGIGCSAKGYVQWDYVTLRTYVGDNKEVGVKTEPFIIEEEDEPTPIELTEQEKGLLPEAYSREVVINQQFNGADLTGTQAFGTTDMEGKGIVVNGSGQATTVDDDGNEGVTSGWSFNYSKYDNNVPSFEAEIKVKADSTGVTSDSQVSPFRVFYDGNMDMHISYSHGGKGWSGFVAYGSGNFSGTLFSAQTDLLTEDTFHVINAKFIRNVDLKTTHVVLSVDGTVVMDEASLDFAFNKSVKFGIGAAAGSNIKYDYFKLYRLTPIANAGSGVSIWSYDFNGEATTSNAFGGVGEGKGLFLSGNGYATTVDNDGNEGVAAGWTYSYEGYDKSITNFKLTSKVKAMTDATAADSETASFRFSYDKMWDFQFTFANKEGAWSGLAVYCGSELYRQAIPMVSGTDYVITIMQVANTDFATSHLLVLINDIVVLNIASSDQINPNSNVGVGCSAQSFIHWDYVKLTRLGAVTNLVETSKTSFTFNPEDAGQQAFADGKEGTGIVVNSEGKATTVTADGVQGVSPSYSFSYKGGLELTGAIQVNCKYMICSEGATNGNAPLRIFFGSQMFDIHQCAKVGWAGVACYCGGTVFSQESEMPADAWHTTIVRFIPVEGTTYNMQVSIDNICIFNGTTTIESPTLTKIGIGASDNSYVIWDSITLRTLGAAA